MPSRTLSIMSVALIFSLSCSKTEEKAASTSEQPPQPQKAEIKAKVGRKPPVQVEGAGVLSPREVSKVISGHMGEIEKCYETVLEKDPGLIGKVDVKFTVDEKGKVSDATLSRNGLTPEAGNCLTSVFKRFELPPPEGGPVTYESGFLFTPAK